MESIPQYFLDHWLSFVAIFWVLEKIVKITPTKYDDILVDIIWGGIKRLVGKV